MLAATLPIIAAALVVAVAHLLLRVFHGVHPRVWAVLLALGAIAIGAWSVAEREQQRDIVGTYCEVRKPEVREVDDKRVEIWAKLRWIIDNKPITTVRPMRIATGESAQSAALEQQYPAGSYIECSYFASRPTRIFAEDAASKREWMHATGIGGWPAAALLLAAALHMWHVARRQRRVRTRGLRGAVGAVSMIAIVGGMLVETVLGYVIAGTGAAIACAMIVIEIVGANRAFARVRKQIADAKHWPAPKDPSSSGGWNPYEDDRVTGMYRGRTVWVALHASGATVKARLGDWPRSLELARRENDDAPRTGDDDFDRVVQLGSGDASWRSVLSSRVRAQLATIFARWQANVAEAMVAIELGDGETDALQAALDAATSIELSRAGGDQEARLFELARAEPNTTVRAGHYRWLVERQWNVPLVYRAAADDADRDLAAWGRAELPPEGGAFR
ncbi:MAG: hypothetical protein M3680_06315 [Myxococcota bacterium]|nr:hypothetical protein [Myxococcota bacterium]